MSQCPVCGAEITEDFGIVECSGCQAQLIIHLDGRIEHAGSKSTDIDEDEAVIVHEGGQSDDSPSEFEFPPEEVPEFIEPIREIDLDEMQGETPPPLPEIADGSEEYEEESVFKERTQGTLTPPVAHDFSPSDNLSPEDEDPLAVLDLPDEGAPSESYDGGRKKTHPIDSADLADVAKFANSAESGGRDGSLRYTLFIEGIDTADVREAFKEAITDKKLLWDTENILRSIRKGEVKIENVSSAKAHIVVTRLKLLPISVSWEQHAIHEG